MRAGDKVGIYGYNGNEWVEAQFAAWKLRAVPVNVNYRYVEAELRYLFDNSDAVALVASRQFLPRIAAVRADCPALHAVIAFDDGSDVDMSVAGAEEYEAVLAAASPDRIGDQCRNSGGRHRRERDAPSAQGVGAGCRMDDDRVGRRSARSSSS